ncbi:hypothetical protein Tco_1222906 [Tanacetum coccineum]
MDYITNLYDEVQARIDDDHELAVRLTHEEHKKYTVDERAKLLAEFFERRKKQLAKERVATIRNKPPIRTQLRSLMMTYLKHTERVANFVPIGSEEDERLIQKMNKKAASVHVEKVLEEPDSTKVEVKQEAAEHGAECIYYRIFRSDGSSRWIKTFSEMVTRFDRLDLMELYNLVMQRFETTTPEGIDLVLWGDLRTMFEVNVEDELWQNKKGWDLMSWDFYENYGVHTLTLEDGTEIHMLVERRYPLTKETLERMMSLKLIAEYASDSAYDLLRFIQKQIDEAGSHDEGKKDL